MSITSVCTYPRGVTGGLLMSKIYMQPHYSGTDTGDGGIRRVVEAMYKYMPEYGFSFTDELVEADIVGLHGGEWVNTNKPIVAHCHGLYWREYEWPKWAKQVNHDVTRLCKSADIVTSPSEWVSDILAAELWINPVTIYHGVELDEWPYTPNPDGYILWNKTRIDPICDPEPVNKLASLLPDVAFRSTFGSARLANIELIGREAYVSSKDTVLNSGIYLATSRETFGIGTLEAMAAGKPILGWNWAGQAELASSAGYLAIVGDYEDLLKGYYYITNNYDMLSRAARNKAESLSWKEVMANYGNIYTSLLN